METAWKTIQRNAIDGLRRGVSPRRLALTLALGFAVGCIPLLGIPTVICALLALVFRLSHPAIQAANFAAMPLQVVLLVPLARLGRWLVPMHRAAGRETGDLLHRSALHLAAWMGGLAGQALLAWLLMAVPAVILLTLALTRFFEQVPAPEGAEK